LNSRHLCRRRIVPALLVLALAAFAPAETLTGTATNKTNSKPAAGDEVTLIKLSQGMQEGARTKTNGKGEFSVSLDDPGPHLVRVTHQGVNYFRAAPPGTTAVDIDVYDVAKKLQGISTTVDVMRLQTENGNLEVIELFAVKNQSQPPRTQMSDNNYEFHLPPGAQLDQTLAKAPGGQPVNSSPVPLDQKAGRYTMVFPLRPGETQFEVAYHLPYSGQAKIEAKPLVALEHFVVMLPKEMKFAPENTATFQSMPDENGANVQVVTGVKAGQALAFTVSGNGLLQSENAQAGAGQGGPGGQNANGRPGGGLGPPTDAPDPLHQYRWYLLGGFVLVLGVGAVLIVTRQGASGAPPASPAASARSNGRAAAKAAAASGPESATAPPQRRSEMLLEALKEEIFQLEVEKHQGRISAEEYQKAKSALDQTLQRAITRKKSS
jgi:hypothetical protein